MNKKKEMKRKDQTSGTWLAAYLYRGEPWEKFLIETVKPFVDKTMENRWADRFFFVRYWERGPHIRLRFKGNAETLEKQVKPQLDSYFPEYFREHPSQRITPENIEEFPPEQQWFPNDSVQYIDYEPEIERYGGPAGILIAERQFEASSRAVFAVIEESGDWDYDRALGAAIQLHLGFAFALGMDLVETGEFFTQISRTWFSRAYGYTTDTPKDEIKERQKITLNAFDENFQRQKPTLVPYHQTLWSAFTEEVEFEQEWLNQWLENMTAVKNELITAQEQNTLVIPQWFKPETGKKTPEHRRKLWTIFESYVHMTNNRLGILNRDEAYLGYLIKESLKEVGREIEKE